MLLYTDFIHEVVADIARRVPTLRHLVAEKIGVLAAARSGGATGGNLATCYGLHRDGEPTFSIWTKPRTRQIIAVSEWFYYATPHVRLHGNEMSYVILLRLPRLLLRNPLPTIIHELYHISEKFDRQMRPKKHGIDFDRDVRRITQIWLNRAKPELGGLAQMRLADLQREFGAVLAQAVPSGFIVPMVTRAKATESYERGIARLYPDHDLATRYEIRPIESTPENALTSLVEKDLVLRHYSRTGCERVPKAFARYSRRYLAQSA